MRQDTYPRAATAAGASTLDAQGPTWTNQAPFSAIDVTPTSLTFSWASAIDEVAVVGYTFEFGERSPVVLGPDVTTFTVFELTPNTEYEVTLTAFDAAGHQSAPIRLTVRTDDAAGPIWPANGELLAREIGDTGVRLSWSEAMDDDVVQSYVISQGATVIATLDGQTTSHQVSDLLADHRYTFRVRAIDGAGNVSSGSLELSVRTTDTVAPSWPMDAALTASRVGETDAQVRWPAALDNVGVTEYRIDVDSVAVYFGPATQLFGDLTDLRSGQVYTVEVFARDRLEQWSLGLELSLRTRDETAPEWLADERLNLDAISETEIVVAWRPSPRRSTSMRTG